MISFVEVISFEKNPSIFFLSVDIQSESIQQALSLPTLNDVTLIDEGIKLTLTENKGQQR
jgi:hypothetical protein